MKAVWLSLTTWNWRILQMKLSLTTFTEEIPNIWSEIETIRGKVIEFHQRKRAKAVILNRFTPSNERIKIYRTRFAY